jgi:hypothetical protein
MNFVIVVVKSQVTMKASGDIPRIGTLGTDRIRRYFNLQSAVGANDAEHDDGLINCGLCQAR